MRKETSSLALGTDGGLGSGSAGLVVAALNAASAAARGSLDRNRLSPAICSPNSICGSVERGRREVGTSRADFGRLRGEATRAVTQMNPLAMVREPADARQKKSDPAGRPAMYSWA